MPAKLDLYGRYGTSPSSDTDMKGHIFFTPVDSELSRHSTNPVGKPTGGANTAYSMERYMFYKVAQAPNTVVSNIRLWTGIISSPPATGVQYFIGTTDSYVGPVITKSAIAVHRLHSTYPSYANSIKVTGSLVNVGDDSNFFVVQLHVESTANVGIIDSTRTIVKSAWDES